MRDICGSDTDIEDFFFGQSMPKSLGHTWTMWATRFPFTRDPSVTQLSMHSKYTNHVPEWIPIDRSFGSAADRWLHMRGFDYYDAKLEWPLAQKLALNLDPSKLYSFFERMGPLIGMAGIYAAWNAPFPFSSGEYKVECDRLPPFKYVKRKCLALIDQLLAASHTPEDVKNYFERKVELSDMPPWAEESPLSHVLFWFNEDHFVQRDLPYSLPPPTFRRITLEFAPSE